MELLKVKGMIEVIKDQEDREKMRSFMIEYLVAEKKKYLEYELEKINDKKLKDRVIKLIEEIMNMEKCLGEDPKVEVRGNKLKTDEVYEGFEETK